MARVQLLLGCGVIPVIVFDGGKLPIKGDEEGSRGEVVLAPLLSDQITAGHSSQT